MKSSYQKLHLLWSVVLVLSSSGVSFSGTSGTISGYVLDGETDKSLPGASITVDGTDFGAMTDKEGFYIIHNVPVGTYTLRASMIGYVPMKLTEVDVKTDLNTTMNFVLSSHVLKLQEEIVVTSPRVQILRDVLSSTEYLEGDRISNTLPAETFYDILPLAPGYVANHFRGSRMSNTQFLIDGLPASGPMTREMAFMVPNSSIAEMVVQTGGFNAEYGNVTSSVVNIITKEGMNDFFGTLTVASDRLGRQDRNYDNANRAEFAIGGPLTFGFGGPMLDANYLVSGSVHMTDTPFRRSLRQSFSTPLFFNYDLNAKVRLRVANNLHIRWQTLASNWKWRRYDPFWADRSSALPRRINDNRRMDLSLTHTLSPRMYYTLELSRLNLHREILGEIPASATPNLRIKDIHSLSSEWPGRLQPWEERLSEQQLTARLSLVRQLHPRHQIKLGLEADLWNISLDRARYLLWPDGSPGETEFVYSRYDDNFRRKPYSAAAYSHYKIELPGFLATIGLRYQVFSPNTNSATLPGIEPFASDSNAHVVSNRWRLKHTLAPRLNIAIPVGTTEHLSLSYGWFYELPPFYYLYFNKEGDLSAFWPIFGNVDLEPIRAKAWEITYRRAVSERTDFSFTGFYRQYDNLIDTVPYEADQPGVTDQERTVIRYENRAKARMGGFELTYRRQMTRNLEGRITYTNLRSSGTASWPESNFLSFSRRQPDSGDKQSPLDWDQRHAFTFNLTYESTNGPSLSVLSRIDGPASAVEWLSDDKTELGWRHFLDFKFSVPLNWAGIRLNPFLEVRNLLNQTTVDPEQGGIDFSQPTSQFEQYRGRRIWIGVTYR